LLVSAVPAWDIDFDSGGRLPAATAPLHGAQQQMRAVALLTAELTRLSTDLLSPRKLSRGIM